VSRYADAAIDNHWVAWARLWVVDARGHSVYSMRMARVNITMPDDLYGQAKEAGLNVSQLAQRAVAAELTRLARVAELDAYLAELETELGPTTESERIEARIWADKALGSSHRRRSA
jgi:post-segregation antitoxin (ccd killing protein)